MNRTAGIKLSPRLQMAADMVRKGVRIADIGTDHAYIPVYLVQNGICPGGIAADLRESPLANARATVNACGLTAEVALRLSDGLDEIAPGEADDIILAGMGGTLIADLVKRTLWLRDHSKHLILQPMTHAEDVRAYLCENGYEILYENACFEAHRCYIAMCARFAEKLMLKAAQSYYYIGELPACGNTAALEHLSRQYARLNKRACALEVTNKNPQEAAMLKKIIDDISGVL